MSECLFYLFATLAVASAIFMVAARSAVNSALGMIVTLAAVAADYFLLDAPFLGVLQILVYAGAVMVLFLFIIMLLDVDKTAATPRPFAKWLAGAVVLGVAIGVTAYALTAGGAVAEGALAAPENPVKAALPHAATAKAFGYGLFTKYMLPVQIAGFLLLSAMIGVVTLVRRPKEAA